MEVRRGVFHIDAPRGLVDATPGQVERRARDIHPTIRPVTRQARVVAHNKRSPIQGTKKRPAGALDDAIVDNECHTRRRCPDRSAGRLDGCPIAQQRLARGQRVLADCVNGATAERHCRTRRGKERRKGGRRRRARRCEAK